LTAECIKTINGIYENDEHSLEKNLKLIEDTTELFGVVANDESLY
jgi:hypothetical protein